MLKRSSGSAFTADLFGTFDDGEAGIACIEIYGVGQVDKA